MQLQGSPGNREGKPFGFSKLDACPFTTSTDEKHVEGMTVTPGIVGWDSSVGIATRYWLGGPGIESRWVQDSPHPSRPTLGPTQPSKQWASSFIRGGKETGAWR